MSVSFDIVIPSFRLLEQFIVPILDLPVPPGVDAKFYLVIDNPSLEISPAISKRIDNRKVFCYRNPENKGAALSRNKGIEMGSGEWILFLDDDIFVPTNLLNQYKLAVDQFPGEIGFIGLVNFPPASNTFTKSVVASGSMDIFAVANTKPDYAWGATANMMVTRQAVGDIRFSPLYPKAGGGEDVDFFLKIRNRFEWKNFKTLSAAAVDHPWWKGESADYKRPFRYGKGNAILAIRNPEFVYRDLFNTVELILILLILLVVSLLISLQWSLAIVITLIGIVLIDYIATAVQVIKRTGKFNPLILYHTMMLRLSFQLGTLVENITRNRWTGIAERFNDNGSTRKNHLFRFNTYKIVKWVLYPALAYFVWKYLG